VFDCLGLSDIVIERSCKKAVVTFKHINSLVCLNLQHFQKKIVILCDSFESIQAQIMHIHKCEHNYEKNSDVWKILNIK
jgi:hypothetical protein